MSGWVEDPNTRQYTEKTYSDRVSPSIVKVIQQEEDPDRPLMDKIKLAQTVFSPVPAESDLGGAWGVAIWYNVDPALDFISVKVSGLTNAYRMELNQDKSITFVKRKLQLNYWRPGDGIDQSADKIVYGIPLTDDPFEQALITERYHLPGPQIRGSIQNLETLRSTLIFETDAEVAGYNFESGVAAELDANRIPASITSAFSNAGFDLADDAAMTMTVAGKQWVVNDSVDGQARRFIIELHPEFWEKKITGGIRFIKPLDHLWVYE